MAGRLFFPEQRALDSNGDPISGAKLYTFATNSTTNQATYTTSALSVQRSNPVVADSSGHFGDIWAPSDVAFRLVVTNGAESSYAGGTPLPSGDHDPIYATGASSSPAPLTKSSAYAVTSDDQGADIYATGTWALTLPLGSGLPAGFRFRGVNEGVGTITLTASGGDLIGSASTKTLGRSTAWDIEWTGTVWKAVEVSAGIGRHSLWIPADALLTRVTSGPSISVTETTTNKINRRTLDFDASSIEYAQFRIAMPKSPGTRARSRSSRCGRTGPPRRTSRCPGGCRRSPSPTPRTATPPSGPPSTATTPGGSTGFVYVGVESAAITIAGTPATEDVVTFQVLRKADDAVNDTLAVDASLIGLRLFLNTDAGSDS
jgi:hypothetical protein